MSATVLAIKQIAAKMRDLHYREFIATAYVKALIKKCNRLTAEKVSWQRRYYESAGYPVRRLTDE